MTCCDDDPFTNPAVIRDPALDQALADGRATMDRDQRRRAYVEVQRRVHDNGSWLYLVRPRHIFVVSTRVSGVDPMAAEGHLHGLSRGLLWNLPHWRVSG